MGTVFAAVAPDAGIDAEKVGIGAIEAFSKRNTDLWNRDFAGIADSKNVLA